MDIIKYEGDKNKIWKCFAKYHYLSHYHNNAAHIYICLINGVLAGFASILPFPHPVIKNYKRIHRVVILPDFQGVGIGTTMINVIAKSYRKKGYKLIITTSSPAFIYSLCKDKKWIATTKKGRKNNPKKEHGCNRCSNSSINRFTVSFKYIGD